MVRLRTSTATSAGGIVVRHEKGQPWLVVGSRRRERDGRTWTLPKGTPHPGETREETALREVQEETGLKVKITGTLDSIEYWFVQSGTRIHKTVHYFLMEPAGGDLAKHDHEFDEVRWVPFDSAVTMLTFETERTLVAHAAAVLKGRRRAAGRDRGRGLRRGSVVTDAADPPIHLTPLNDAHQDLGARLIEFSGWLMPVQYGSIIEEHRTVRTKAGLFDLSHMGELYVEGPEAGLALAAALVSDPPSLAVGRAHYSMMTMPDGGIVDDLIVYRLADERFLVVANAGNAGVVSDALAERLTGFRAVLDDRSLATGLLAVQGPLSAGLLAPLTDVDLGALRYYAAAEGTVAGIPGLVARTGYTGEDGFEVFVDTAQTVPLWNALLAAVRDAGGLPIGLGARDTLRLEAGMPLYGNELDLGTDPYQAGLGRVVKLGKTGDFVGRAALEKIARDGPSRRLVGLTIEGRGIARHGYPVWSGERRTGVVTSGTQSPTLGVPIAMAYVAPGDAEPGTVLDIEIRDARVPARVVTLPFYRRDG